MSNRRISGRKLCAFALAAALALITGAQFVPAHYAWAEDEPAATVQADATLPDAAPLEEALPEVAALAPVENAPHLDLANGSIILKDSGSNLQYSQDDEATWTSYSGNVTIGGTAGSGTNVQVLNGTHTILLNGVTINEPRANHAAIEIGSDTQAAQLTLWLYGSNKLSGSSGYPAIFAPGKAHLIFKGDLYGSLEAQGGYEAPAIGADSAVSSCGTIEFWQPGNVTARSGNGAPALGDPTSSAVDATGSVSFFSGNGDPAILRHLRRYREKHRHRRRQTFTSRSAPPAKHDARRRSGRLLPQFRVCSGVGLGGRRESARSQF